MKPTCNPIVKGMGAEQKPILLLAKKNWFNIDNAEAACYHVSVTTKGREKRMALVKVEHVSGVVYSLWHEKAGKDEMWSYWTSPNPFFSSPIYVNCKDRGLSHFDDWIEALKKKHDGA